MMRSVLVANRGEIACRIFRTARAMGLRCLAVHSDVDSGARHVREADASFPLGPAPAAESYLRGARILEAARALGAEAIHPGYGFLSENAEFAEAVIAAGLIWIGPTPASIRAMGLKDEAKRLAAKVGVPVLEGYAGEDQSEKRLLKAAREIGWPVLIKAVAGGGGRGIREARSAEELKAGLAAARREAAAAFGDDRVLIEKLVERPRHIEVQVFGDSHGQIVHVYERDCSLQRRRQKVIEEAPAPGMTEPVRAAMTEAALKLAHAVSYQNAGTVEFIVDGSGPLRAEGFWFLEMNTRLQVEHPVTEMVTGLDLVEWQLRVAAGEKLPKSQDQIHLNGHAIEARICAEDPAEAFRPSVGRIDLLCEPSGARFDCGYASGDAIPAHYDNLIGKMIGHGSDRYDAIEQCAGLLSRTLILGPRHNVGFLRRILEAADFVYAAVQHGDLETGFLAKRHDALARAPDPRSASGPAAAFASGFFDAWRWDRNPWERSDGFRLNAPPRRDVAFMLHGQAFRLVVDRLDEGRFEVRRPGEAVIYRHAYPEGMVRVPGVTLRGLRDPDDAFYLLIDFVGRRLVQDPQGDVFELLAPGESADLAGADAPDELRAPLPGKIVAVNARAGQSVARGEPLLILEAMKMEHTLKAPRDGVIAVIAAEEGAHVIEGAVLARLAPQEPTG